MRFVALVALSLLVAGCGEALTATERPAPPRPAAREPPRGVVERCSTRSEADFPGAFTGADNVVVGPLSLVGAAHTPLDTIREFGGDKLFALLRPGHRVTLALPRGRRGVAAFGYGPLPELVELTPADGHRVVTLVSCAPGEPSGSTADGEPVTLWVGFLLATKPQCLPISVWVDDDPSPHHAVLRVGVRRCATARR